MKNKASKRNPNQEAESIIQAVGARMGEQIGGIVMESLREALTKIRESQRMSDTKPTENRDEFLTAGEVAKILKISRALAYRMIQTRELPSFSIGRTVRVRRVDLDVFIESHMIR